MSWPGVTPLTDLVMRRMPPGQERLECVGPEVNTGSAAACDARWGRQREKWYNKRGERRDKAMLRQLNQQPTPR